MIFAPEGKLPNHLPLIEIDYNVIDSEGLTRFRYKNVQSHVRLIIGQYVTCYQPEDGTYTTGVIYQLGHKYGKVLVHWDKMKEYSN